MKRKEIMWQPAPPPEAPKDAEKLLLELANYYQELVEYHQQAAREASVRLSQVEALIGKPKIISVESVNVEAQITTESLKDPDLTELIEGEEISHLKPNKNWLESASFPDKPKKTSEKLLRAKIDNNVEAIKQLLRQNRGKILHIDYIELELSQNSETTLEQDLREILIKGEKKQLWASVPDSPGCWTIDLKDIADLAPTPKSQNKKTTQKKKKESVQAVKVENKAYSGRQMMKRLKCGDRLLRIKRTQSDFSEWSQQRDPDGIAWKYQKGRFVPQIG